MKLIPYIGDVYEDPKGRKMIVVRVINDIFHVALRLEDGSVFPLKGNEIELTSLLERGKWILTAINQIPDSETTGEVRSRKPYLYKSSDL